MSLDKPGFDSTAQLRALAHPIRLRILSLLTGAPMTAADIARELDITHANASYHLRHLLASGRIQVAGEERIRGGVAKRYRYDAEADFAPRKADVPDDIRPTADHLLIYEALATELRRRSAHMHRSTGNHLTDAELWVRPDDWKTVKDQVAAASATLHRAALPPHSPGAIRVSATIALFTMDPAAR